MGKSIDITGQKFGNCTVIKHVGINKWKNYTWLVRHDCGHESIKSQGKIVRGKNTASCPICNKHGMFGTRFYWIYGHIGQRCNKKDCPEYRFYGGRGIKCLWSSFIDFKNDMHESYLKHCKDFGIKETTIDRIDNNGNYCKENCKWSTWHEQHTNTRQNRFITFSGLTLTIGDWARKLNINYRTLGRRLDHSHWSVERTLTEIPYHGKNQFSKN